MMNYVAVDFWEYQKRDGEAFALEQEYLFPGRIQDRGWEMGACAKHAQEWGVLKKKEGSSVVPQQQSAERAISDNPS